MVNAQLMFKYGGDGQWGQLVRSCLLCMYDFNMSPQQAHGFCYNDAARRVGQTNAILGYSWAIGAAFVIETYQIYQFINGGDLEQAVGPWIQQAIDITLDHILKSVQ